MSAPVYQEIKDFILARIHAGEWAEGDQVPSENDWRASSRWRA
jgi:GntR family histidine utilization transcriptional repressor